MNRWPFIGPWASNTRDSEVRIAQQQAAALFGRPWHEIAALLRERINEIDEGDDQ